VPQRIVASRQAPDQEAAWPTVVGTIRRGMRVIAPDGACLGTVSSVQGEEILLEPLGSGDQAEFLALSQVDGVNDTSVLLSGRGDATFGLGSEP
jgi:hypothetical protein